MNLTAHFTLSECIKSDTAERLGIDNTPDQNEIDNLKATLEAIAEPVRKHFNRRVFIRSGFRCLALNRAIGSKDNSQHVKGEAIDLEVDGISNNAVAEWIRDNLEFDQCIREFAVPGDPSSGWIHVSYTSDRACRRQCLTVNRQGTFEGFLS